MSDVQTTETPTTAPVPTWYTLKQVNGFTVFDETVQAATQPANSTEWAPHVLPAGMTSYWNGSGWEIGIDINQATFSVLQGIALKQAQATLSQAVGALGAGYPQIEQRSWRTQANDAAAVLTGGTPSALITALASARKVDVKTLAQKIVSKSEAYNTGYATALAAFQATRDQIMAAKIPADLPAFTVPPVPRIGG